MTKIVETPRLILRPWQEGDVLPYYRMNQDPKVVEFLPSSITIDQTKSFIKKMNQQLVERDYTLWAVELKDGGGLLGFVGLNDTDFEASFTPAVEIGWRLASQYWGFGYATEAARAILDYGKKLSLKEIVSFTVPQNKRSIRVMEKIGLNRDPLGDFYHPKLPREHDLSRHVLYRILFE